MKNIIYIMLLGLGMIRCQYDNELALYPPDPAACDTLQLSYSADIIPILERNCNSCHSQSAQRGGVILEGYNELLIQINNGRLLGSIRWDTGFSPMPPDTDQLTDCQILKIASWIHQGALDN